MDAKFTREGVFQLKRHGKWETQYCPRTAKMCGDWCPFLSEPMSRGGKWFISNCQGQDVEYENVIDERG